MVTPWCLPDPLVSPGVPLTPRCPLVSPQGQVADGAQRGRRGAVPHGGRGLHLLVQVSCEWGAFGGSQGFLGGLRGLWGIPDPLLMSPPQNFKREEQNFVVQNEINNMSFLTADSKSKMAKVGWGHPRTAPKLCPQPTPKLPPCAPSPPQTPQASSHPTSPGPLKPPQSHLGPLIHSKIQPWDP